MPYAIKQQTYCEIGLPLFQLLVTSINTDPSPPKNIADIAIASGYAQNLVVRSYF